MVNAIKTAFDGGDDRLTKAADIVRANLEAYYSEFHFDVIPEQRPVDDVSEDLRFIRLFVIFDGDREDLKSRWKPGLVGRVRKDLTEVEISEFPVLSFVTKSEWEAEAQT